MKDQKVKPPLVVILGPTAVGKTAMSLKLAERWNGEIISGDSMQVYRGMNIGTAKATEAERAQIPHHLIDICNPEDSFSAAEFQSVAKEAIIDIGSRGKLPFIVGGTGLYIQSLCFEYNFEAPSADEAIRNQLEAFADEYGEQALHEKLGEVDALSAQKIHPNDRRRVIRALEVYEITGIPQSKQVNKSPESPYQLCLIGLTMDRSLLYERIEQRIDLMLAEGLVDEVRMLMEKGYDKSLVSMHALGYKEMINYLEGAYSYEHAVYLLKRDTRRFAKRQLSWFRHMPGIEWVDVTQSDKFCSHYEQISDIICKKIGNE